VQRGNAEMQRRAQEVIDAAGSSVRAIQCFPFTMSVPGGLSNAAFRSLSTSPGGVPGSSGAPCPTKSPAWRRAELWCNEAQERFVLAVAAERIGGFQSICERERARPPSSAFVTDE